MQETPLARDPDVQPTLSTVGLFLLVWLFTSTVWAGLMGLASMGATYFLFERRVRNVLADALGGDKARRAMNLAVNGKRHMLALTIVVTPVVASVLGLLVVLPQFGLFGHPSDARKSAVSISTGKNSPDIKGSGTLENAFQLHQKKDYIGARAILKSLAEKGDPLASGAYGYMILLGQGLPAGTNLSAVDWKAQYARAKPWINKGAAPAVGCMNEATSTLTRAGPVFITK